MTVRPGELLEEIYFRALYRVDAGTAFVLRVGQFSDALLGLYEESHCTSAAFLTAANPRGMRTPDEINARAETALQRQLQLLGLQTIPGIGLDADENSDWPGERSVFVLGIKKKQAIELGRDCRQLAILWCPPSAIPELLIIDHDCDPNLGESCSSL